MPRWLAIGFLWLVAASMTSCGAGPRKATPCRLPLYETSPGVRSGEFLRLPEGSLEVDPDGGISSDHRGWFTDKAPALRAAFDGAPTYSFTTGRWVPAGAADEQGRRYAYSTAVTGQPGLRGGDLHIVDVASAKDQVVFKLEQPLSVVGFFQNTAYMVRSVEYQGQGGTAIRATELWMYDLTGKKLKMITSDDHEWEPANAKVAWAIGREEQPSLLPGDGNTILRLDMESGAIERWFLADGGGRFVQINGFDGTGRPVLTETRRGEVTPAAPVPFFTTLMVLEGKNKTKVLVQEHLGDPEVSRLQAAGRDSTIWFAGGGGIFSYSDDKGWVKLASGVGHGFALGGTCR